MTTIERTKINQLLSLVPQGAVMLTSWLLEQGYSADLQKYYRNSGWLKTIGKGAMIRAGDDVSYQGAVYALQEQMNLSIHPGGRNALWMLGKAHYLELSQENIVLFGSHGEKLPVWFKNHEWGLKLVYYRTSFLPHDLGLTEFEQSNFQIKISGAVRALMECLYLAPDKQDLLECYELMEGLNNLRPQEVQQLLEECRSVKVKRLFLYMAEKADHRWLAYVDTKKIDLGKGKRHLVDNGVFVSKYKITVPRKLEQNETANI